MPVATSARIGFEKAKIYRGFLPIKEVIKTDNSDRTSTPSNLSQHRAGKIKVLRCYRYPMGTGSVTLFLFIIYYLFK